MEAKVLTSQKEKRHLLRKIGKVTIPVPFPKPGNVIEHISVQFKVCQNGNGFEAFPALSDAEQRLVNLPRSIPFQIKRGKVTNTKYKYIAKDILQKLKGN